MATPALQNTSSQMQLGVGGNITTRNKYVVSDLSGTAVDLTGYTFKVLLAPLLNRDVAPASYGDFTANFTIAGDASGNLTLDSDGAGLQSNLIVTQGNFLIKASNDAFTTSSVCANGSWTASETNG